MNIGRPYGSLQYEIDSAVHDYHWAESAINELKRKHELEMKPAAETLVKAAEKCRKIHEAVDYARENKIGT